MKTRNRNIANLLIALSILSMVVLASFPGTSWSAVSTFTSTPADKSKNIPVNTTITIQFSESMDPSSYFNFGFEDEWGRKVAGTYQWSTTAHASDTLKFTPAQALRPGMHYYLNGGVFSLAGILTDFELYFITEPSPTDITPPTVQVSYPYDGMTDVPTNLTIICMFSEAIDPSTVNATNITLSGPGIGGSGDYKVSYDWYDGHIEIRKNTQLSAFQTYTVKVTTNLRDLNGNKLQNPYQWSFTTGAADSAPTVLETIPVDGATEVNAFPFIHAIFSKEMDEDAVNTSNITLHDNTAGFNVNINVELRRDRVIITPSWDIQLQNGHNHTLTIGTGVKDLAGNGLSSPYYLNFAVAGAGVDSEPVITNGTKDNENFGMRSSDGSKVQLYVGAIDDFTAPLTVYATTPPSYEWNLTTTDNWNYYYDSSADEGLSSGPHNLTFTIKDSTHTVTFQRDIFISDAFPALTSPANGATAVSTAPTFQWSYGGSLQPLFYVINVFDAPSTDSAHLVWQGFGDNPGALSLSIPYDKQLAPNTTYYWLAIGIHKPSGNDMAVSEMRSFTTGNGSVPPSSISIQSPSDASVFNSCSVVTGSQPTFNWVPAGTYKNFTILFSTSSTDFTKPIVKATIQASKNSWTAAIGVWKKIMTLSDNNGSIQDIYWKVIGTMSDKTAVESEVRSFRIGDAEAVTINLPSDGANLPPAILPTFDFNSNCNVKFRLEFSSLNDFSNPTKIKGFVFTTSDTNLVTALQKVLTKGQWTTVKKLVGSGTGFFRIKAWDGIKRETASVLRSFTAQ